MAKKKKGALNTLITFVQDETGSMSSIQDATIDAFNEYFKGLRGDKDLGEVSLLVMQFSDAAPEERVRILHDGPIADVPTLDHTNYRPRGITPLLDAVGTAIRQAETKKVDRHLLIVQTDGYENASRDFTLEQVSQMVGEKEKAKNWTIVFLGAGVNQWAKEAGAMGVRGQSVMAAPATAGGIAASYSSLAGQTVSYLRSDDLSDKTFAVKAQAEADKEQKKQKK